MSGSMDALARQHHEVLARMAPDFYPESIYDRLTGWDDQDDAYRRMCVAAMSEVIGTLRKQEYERVAALEAVAKAARGYRVRHRNAKDECLLWLYEALDALDALAGEPG